jgi:hypothetical protein
MGSLVELARDRSLFRAAIGDQPDALVDFRRTVADCNVEPLPAGGEHRGFECVVPATRGTARYLAYHRVTYAQLSARYLYYSWRTSSESVSLRFALASKAPHACNLLALARPTDP